MIGLDKKIARLLEDSEDKPRVITIEEMAHEIENCRCSKTVRARYVAAAWRAARFLWRERGKLVVPYLVHNGSRVAGYVMGVSGQTDAEVIAALEHFAKRIKDKAGSVARQIEIAERRGLLSGEQKHRLLSAGGGR